MTPAELSLHIQEVRKALEYTIPKDTRYQILQKLKADKNTKNFLQLLKAGSETEPTIEMLRQKTKELEIDLQLPAGMSDEVLAEEISERREVWNQLEILADKSSLDNMGKHMVTLSAHNPPLYEAIFPLSNRFMHMVAEEAGLAEKYAEIGNSEAIPVPITQNIADMRIPAMLARRALVRQFMIISPPSADDPLWIAMVDMANQPTLAKMKAFLKKSQIINASHVAMLLCNSVINHIENTLKPGQEPGITPRNL